MTKYRHALPQLGDELFLTDSGLETYLYFQQGIDLPEFAAFPLLDDAVGRLQLSDYFKRHIEIAVDNGLGFVLELPTWRANPDWGRKLGYNATQLAQVNRAAIKYMIGLRDRFETQESKMVVSGNIGPRHDAYSPSTIMTIDEAQKYHAGQINAFAEAGADMVTALTMTHVEEAAGVAWAAQAAGMPVVISFTTETDGRIPVGQSLGQAITELDVLTAGSPAYYMVNCAHPTHFDHALRTEAKWVKRIRGIRANASTRSHEELDNSTELDQGNPHELGAMYRGLRDRMPQLTVLGGCCGTDHRHVEQICSACKMAA